MGWTLPGEALLCWLDHLAPHYLGSSGALLLPDSLLWKRLEKEVVLQQLISCYWYVHILTTVFCRIDPKNCRFTLYLSSVLVFVSCCYLRFLRYLKVEYYHFQ